MPVINNETIANAAYSMEGSIDKLVRLENGWLVTVLKDGYSIDSILRCYVDRLNGDGFVLLASSEAVASGFALTASGNTLHVIVSYMNREAVAYSFDVPSFNSSTFDSTTAFSYAVDKNQSNVGIMTMTLDKAKNELHAAWSGKHSVLLKSFNIRYAKGAIQSNGSVVWGAVEQLTTMNVTGQGASRPSIILKSNGYPSIITPVEKDGKYIQCLNFNGATWSTTTVYDGGTYEQSNANAIFVPKSVNGLTNGRIWVTWNSKWVDNTSQLGVRSSYSDDEGITWSTSSVVQTSSTISNRCGLPSITCSKSNDIYISSTVGSSTMIYKRWTGTVWAEGQYSTSLTGLTGDVSTLYDPSLDFSMPLTMYTSSSKVGFYGSWIVNRFSPSMELFIGKDSFFSYELVIESPLVPITEKVNGKVIRTFTPSNSSDEYDMSLTQEQWDAIRFGKYSSIATLPSLSEQSWVKGTGVTVINSKSFSVSASTAYQGASLPSFDVVVGETYILSFDAVVAVGSMWVRIYSGENSSGTMFVQKTDVIGGRQTFTFVATTPKISIYILGWLSSVNASISNIGLLGASDNRLTIEMGSSNWEYKFNKKLVEDSDLISSMKAIQDANEVSLPAVKSRLSTAIHGKGGSVSDADSWKEIEKAVVGIPIGVIGGKKTTSGTSYVSPSYKTFTNSGGGNVNNLSWATINTSLIPFTPSMILVLPPKGAAPAESSMWTLENQYDNGTSYGNSLNKGTLYRVPFVKGSMDIPLGGVASQTFTWIAYD